MHSKMAAERFLVVTPMARTTSGSVGSAMATRFCTSTWAMSDVGADLERHVQGVGAVVVALRRHVHHFFDAVDLLLDGSGHGVGHDLGVGAGVDGGNPDHRRRDLRIFGDGQEARGDAPEQEDHDRKHTRQDWAVDEETCHGGSFLFLLAFSLQSRERP